MSIIVRVISLNTTDQDVYQNALQIKQEAFSQENDIHLYQFTFILSFTKQLPLFLHTKYRSRSISLHSITNI